MSFLNSMMLFGTAAIAVPIIIHFLNRRKFKTIPWAAMKFVKLSVDQNQRRMRLEDLILLLIRCALLALLAFALARPALKNSTTDVFGQTKVTGVVVLDNSYSMDLRGLGGKTGFEQARAAAKAALDALPSGSAVSVLLASDVVQSVIDEPTYDLNQAHEEIDRAKVSHHATDLYPAVARATEILKERAALRKEIYVITDGQASGWQQNVDIQRLIENNKDDIDVYVLRVGEQEPPRNLAITKMDISSGLTPVKHPLRFEVEVANHDPNKSFKDVAVGLYVDGEENPRDQVTIAAVPPGGTASVPLYTRLNTTGFHSIRAAFPDPEQYDKLPADNQMLLVVRAVKEVRVLVVDGDQNAEDIRDHESFFLRIALSPTADHYVKVDVKSPSDYARGGLENYTVVAMANVPRLTQDNVSGLQTYLRNGGGLIFYPGDKVDVDFYNRELFEKHGLLPSRWGKAAGKAAQDDEFVEFQKRAYEHPVTALWNNPEFGELGAARTFRWLPMGEEAKQPAVKEAGVAKVVLRFENKPKAGEEEGILGAPAIMEREWGKGRVYQFSSTADTDWCDLPIRGSSVVPLVYRIIGSVQSHQDAGLNLHVGQEFILPLAAHQNNSEGTVKMLMPALGQTNTLTAEVLNDRPVLRFKNTHQAGLYEFQMNGGLTETLFAVQPDQRESDLRKIVDADLPDGANLIHWDSSTDFKAKVQEARVGAEYWLLILLIVLALAGLETFLAQKFSQSK